MARLLVLLPALALLAAIATAVDYSVVNNAASTPGGMRFETDIGDNYAQQVLSDASGFVWDTFNEQSPSDRKDVSSVSLSVDDMDGVAYTSGNAIHLSARYVAGYGGDVKTEITGVLYHEVTHVWQWNGNGQTPSGLIEGIADFVRLRAGFAPSHWVQPGAGDRWDQGYDVTARFLDYVDGRFGGFVARLNGMMRDGYSADFFVQLTGETVDKLWSDYKAIYSGN